MFVWCVLASKSLAMTRKTRARSVERRLVSISCVRPTCHISSLQDQAQQPAMRRPCERTPFYHRTSVTQALSSTPGTPTLSPCVVHPPGDSFLRLRWWASPALSACLHIVPGMVLWCQALADKRTGHPRPLSAGSPISPTPNGSVLPSGGSVSCGPLSYCPDVTCMSIWMY